MIASSGEFNCATSCSINVTNDSFDQTFVAIPTAGYEFKRWRRQTSGLCGGKVDSCRIVTAGFSAFDSLVAILESDQKFYMTPIFQRESGWGADVLSESFRPATSWESNFSVNADVIANASIGEAIDSCDSVVGNNEYCVVLVENGAVGLPLEIIRGRTKLLGHENKSILSSASASTYISIGDGVKDVVIEGLNLQGRSVGNDEIYGIFVQGKNIKRIIIRNNQIHDFDSDENAHGIAVYGTGDTEGNAVSDVLIEGNQIYAMRTGSSESIVVNGNVRNWEISKNTVSDINNIAIDAIGGEGTSPAIGGNTSRLLPGILDAARYGFIEDNRVENMSTLNNPAYDNVESWAAAIYVDGGHNIAISRNEIVDASWGIEVGAENCVTTRHISVRENTVSNSTYGDLLIGGYAEQGYLDNAVIDCDPNNSIDANEGHGYAKFVTAAENQFNSQGTEEELVTVQFRTTHSVIAEPGTTAANSGGSGSASGDANAIRISEQ